MATAEFQLFFFFSSRRRHTRSLCDWSSDVCSSDLLTIQSRAKERPHPATFPVQLAELCIKLHGPAGAGRIQTMLDPFLGIGNSAVAAQRCSVKRFIGFEIDESYLTEAKRRLALRKQ